MSSGARSCRETEDEEQPRRVALFTGHIDWRRAVKNSRRIKRMSRNRVKVTKMNLTSLMDVFTILVFFLLVNSATTEVLETPKQITLPASVVEEKPRETVVIFVSPDEVTVQGESVARVEDILAADGQNIAPIGREAGGAELEEHHRAQDQDRGREPGGDDSRGRSVPFSVVKKVMSTCTSQGYGRISLAVLQKSPERRSRSLSVIAGGRSGTRTTNRRSERSSSRLARGWTASCGTCTPSTASWRACPAIANSIACWLEVCGCAGRAQRAGRGRIVLGRASRRRRRRRSRSPRAGPRGRLREAAEVRSKADGRRSSTRSARSRRTPISWRRPLLERSARKRSASSSGSSSGRSTRFPPAQPSCPGPGGARTTIASGSRWQHRFCSACCWVCCFR